ncbi:MAG: efflux RND transporter periplasmic adaptor subunit [Kordiimonas sp.]
MRGIKLEKKSLLPLAAGAVVFGLGFFTMSAVGGGDSDNGTTAIVATKGPLVETTTASLSDGIYSIEAPGRLQPRQQLAIVAEVSGKVSYINPKFVVGGRLNAGETLFKVNATDYKADVSRANAAVKSAEATLVQAKLANRRQLDLVKQGAVSEAAKDTAVANLAAAEAGLQQAKAQLSQANEKLARTEVKAPFPALVASEAVSLDTYVAPGQNLASLIDASTGELVAGLSPEKAAMVSRMFNSSETHLKAIAKPNNGSVGSGTLEGYLDQFSPVIDEASRSALAVAVFPGAFAPENAGRIFANDFMTLEISVHSDGTVWQVPTGVVRKGQFVWIIKDGSLERRDVTVVNTQQEQTLIKSEQNLANEEILLTSLSEESEGLAVRTVQQSAANTSER